MDLPALRRPHVVMGLLFFPRGGSAQVTRSLSHALLEQGWEVTIVCSSLRLPSRLGDARTFFGDLDVRPLDCTTALHAPDPLCADPPLHPSYEDRPGTPDRVFATVDDATYEHLVASWARVLREACADRADLLHLHHLTPLNAAAARVAPDVPVVGHLHGTELLLLEIIEQGPPAHWGYAGTWAKRLRRWAATCQRLVVPSATQLTRAQALLGIDPARYLLLPNGFDPKRFDRRSVDRMALWHRLLVERPQGWGPGSEVGAVRYPPHALCPFAQGPVLLYVGRFTAVKRLDLLITSYTRAREAFAVPAPLVLLGGFPGEWEGEHPLTTIQRTGARDVFLAGWHDHDELPDIFAASDVVVLPSVCEQFPLVLVEGMACGLPAIAVATCGPSEIVTDGQTGWLVPPDDERALAAALVAAVNDAPERRRRGIAAAADVRTCYSWPMLGAKLAGAYEALLSRPLVT
jgi:glycosyltransferase involved in cell wall biosynthesis